ncbi:TonB-dependent receptor [Pelagibacteraceae bacterium]|nr:TonB-dependent receptor [Pelagibacteraceae bacterium]
MKNIFLISVIFLTLVSFNKLVSADVPTIVISAGKTPQSLSTVGTNVTIISGDTIRNSSSSFLGDVIDSSTSGTNFFQSGGEGTNMGIQLRGLEKRYSTVYVDGVKMSDPSTPDNSFYLQHIMKDSIEKVEILKGNQSTLYGANAIGGTIHIFTKKGKEGHRSTTNFKTGSNDTKSAYYSVDGANDKIDYYLGLNRFLTGGISARNDDGESDKYRNESLNGNFGYKINENLRIENSLGYTNTDLKYDAVSSSTDTNNRSDDILANFSLRVIHDSGKNNNTLSYNKLYSERKTTNKDLELVNYFGFRDAINYTGTYNISLDNRLVYGAEAEFDSARYGGDYAPSATSWKTTLKDKPADESIVSTFFDYQFRPTEKLYATAGLRADSHSSAGAEPSARTTLAYQLDNLSTIRSSWGSGVRFPALYDIHYANGNTNVSGGGKYSADGYEGLTAEDIGHERANSFDVGYETYLENLDLSTSITYFFLEQKNGLNGDQRNNWKLNNTHGVNTSKGIELGLNWKPEDKKYGVDFDYTFTETFDSNTCDSGGCHRKSSNLADAKVRVPRNTFSSKITHNTLPDLKNSVQIKFVDETRDFGDGNNSFKDVILEDYTTINLTSNYRLYDTYDLFFDAKNIFDDNYEQAHGYSSMGRSLNFGIKRVY